MGEERKKNRLVPLAVIALIAATLAAFGVSVGQRASHFGLTGGDMAGAFTAGSTLMARHWDREGAWKLRFVMYWEPDSIEYPTLASRTPYISYPPGCILPLYALGKISAQGPTVPMTMGYNLANQAAIAFSLGLLAFLLLQKMGYPILLSLPYSLLPIFLYLWLPSPYYEHQMGYFADSAVILPFALCVLVEIFRTEARNERQQSTLALLQGVIAFWGMFTDWLFAFVLLCVWLVRLVSGEMGTKPGAVCRKTLVFWTPATMAILLFFLQLWHLGAIQQLALRFVHRTGMDGGGLNALRPVPREVFYSTLFTFSLRTRFWETFIPAAYGMPGKVSLLAAYAALIMSLFALLIARLRKKAIPNEMRVTVLTAFLLLAPCLMHYHVFKNHSSFLFHFFSVLKLAPAMAIIPFVLFPAAFVTLICAVLRWDANRCIRLGAAILPIVAILCAWYLHTLGWQRERMYGELDHNMQRAAQFVGAHTGYHDVVFSPEEDIPRHFYVYSMKVTHQGRSIEQIRERLTDVSGECVVNLFLKENVDYTAYPGLELISSHSHETVREEGYILHKIDKHDFEKAYSAWQQQTPEQHDGNAS